MSNKEKEICERIIKKGDCRGIVYCTHCPINSECRGIATSAKIAEFKLKEGLCTKPA